MAFATQIYTPFSIWQRSPSLLVWILLSFCVFTILYKCNFSQTRHASEYLLSTVTETYYTDWYFIFWLSGKYFWCVSKLDKLSTFSCREVWYCCIYLCFEVLAVFCSTRHTIYPLSQNAFCNIWNQSKHVKLPPLCIRHRSSQDYFVTVRCTTLRVNGRQIRYSNMFS